MIICIAVSTLMENDAIGNDVCHQWRVLNRHQIPVVIFTEEFAVNAMRPHIIDKKKFLEMITNRDTTLIYHHGGNWTAGREILEKARCQLFIKYHNVTPPEFFTPYNQRYETYCSQGLEQTRYIAGLTKVTRFLCDSAFNGHCLSLVDADISKIETLPPFHKLDDFKPAGIDPLLAHELLDGKINVLFVGRLVPNKGHHHLIKVIARYVERYDTDIRLNIVGGMDGDLKIYADELESLIKTNHLEENIHITGPVSFDALHTYYEYSHVFLLMSAHEGFCLPVLEAQSHGLPVIALDRCAVSETLGPNQVVFSNSDYQTFASAIHVLFHNDAYRQYLAQQGEKNIMRFSNQNIEKAFFNALGINP